MNYLKPFLYLITLVALTACGSSSTTEDSKPISAKVLSIFTIEGSVGFYDLSFTDRDSLLYFTKNGTGLLTDLDYRTTENFDWRIDESGTLILEFSAANLIHKLTITSGTQDDGELTYEIHNNNDTIADFISKNVGIKTKASFTPPVQGNTFDDNQIEGTFTLLRNDVQSTLNLTKELEITPLPDQVGYFTSGGFIWFIDNASGNLSLIYFDGSGFDASHIQSVITATLIEGNTNSGTVHLSMDTDLDGIPDASLGDYRWIKN